MTRLSTLAALVPVLVSACATAGGPPIPEIAEEINSTLYSSEFTLGPGDRLDLKFAYNIEWNQLVRVQDDGRASFLGVGNLFVMGVSPEDLTSKLKQAYAAILAEPELSVVVSEVAPRRVSVLGEVRNPGAIDLPPNRRMSLIEALARAGGVVNDTAHVSSILLARWDNVAQRQQAWVIDARQKHWGSDTRIFLQENDVLFIPNMPIDDVGIVVNNFVRRMIPLPGFVRP